MQTKKIYIENIYNSHQLLVYNFTNG